MTLPARMTTPLQFSPVEEIIAVANAAQPKLRALVIGVLSHIAKA